MASDWSILSWLNSEGGVPDKKQLKVAEWLCDPLPIRQIEQLEFTDLTNLNHKTKLELSDELWPLRRSDQEQEDSDKEGEPGLVILGFMRRGIPLQHSKATLRRGENEYPLTRLKASATEELALCLLDNIWVRCSRNELRPNDDEHKHYPKLGRKEFIIPRPFEFSDEDFRYLEKNSPSRLDGYQHYVHRFWSEFLGIGSRNVNADWSLLRSRFQLRESLRANELWRLPNFGESKWSVERALLAKLSARLAFSYILAAWVPPEACKAKGPIEVEFEYQERILSPGEQIKRVESLRRRTKKSYERTLSETLDGRKQDIDLAHDGLRLKYVPQTYLGLLDPALDDPDDGGRRTTPREPVNLEGVDRVKTIVGGALPNKVAWRVCGAFRWAWVLISSTFRFLCERKVSMALSTVYLAVVIWLYLNAANGLVFEGSRIESAWAPNKLPWIGATILSNGFAWGAVFLLAASAFTARWIALKLAIARRSTVVLPTWSGGSSSPIYEIVTPQEFSVWQGILARPSNRGRSWKTRPAAELGRKASFWWQDPNDRGHVPDFVAGRPHLLVMELRARLSKDLTFYGFILCLTASALLLIPSLVNLSDPGRWSLLENAGADTVATILLLLPTAGGALLVRPGEDPIASRLLRSDRLAVGLGAVMVSAIAVASILFIGWPDAGVPRNLAQGSPALVVQEKSTRNTDAEAGKLEQTKFEVDLQPEEYWIFWLILGSVSLAMALALLQSYRQNRNLDEPQPDAKQGTTDASRRKPLDIPAPLPALRLRWGRKVARRTLLRLAPRRGVNKVRPCYSLVLPAEGSRIYTPPSPTVLCLIGDDYGSGGTTDHYSSRTERQAALSLARKDLDQLLESGRTNEDPVYSTNDIAWVSSRSLNVVRPVESLLPDGFSSESRQEKLQHLLRLQTANARPSSSKPFGNGGGLCLVAVEPEILRTLTRKRQYINSSRKDSTPEQVGPFLLGSDRDLLGSTPHQETSEELAAAKRLSDALNRASLDFDALLILRSDSNALGRQIATGIQIKGFTDDGRRFGWLWRLRKALEREASARVRSAGSGSGSHPWPSSLESPLGGESGIWKGSRRLGTYTSLRAFLLGSRVRDRFGFFQVQRWFYDHRIRRIPVAEISLGTSPSPKAGKGNDRKGLTEPAIQFFNWIEEIPRVYSRVYARGGFPTEAVPIHAGRFIDVDRNKKPEAEQPGDSEGPGKEDGGQGDGPATFDRNDENPLRCVCGRELSRAWGYCPRCGTPAPTEYWS